MLLKIIFQNEAMCQNFGKRIGEYCYEAYRGRKEICEDCIVSKVLKDGKSRRALRDVQMPDGNILWAEYFSGPFKDENGAIIGAVEVVRDVTEQIRITEECVTLRREVQRQFQFENITTQSKKIKKIFLLIERIASTNSTVLISGESGTGKELIAFGVCKGDAISRLAIADVTGHGEAVSEIADQGLEHLSHTKDLWFHLDVDVLDPVIMPVCFPEPDGINYKDTFLFLEKCMTSGRFIGISIACYHPKIDPGLNAASKLVETLKPAISKGIS